MLKVGLIGHDTRNPNLGVGALTVSHITILQEIAERAEIEMSISVLIGRSSFQSCVADDLVFERYTRPLRKPFDFFKAIRDHDVIIDISGGDSFSDIYGDRRIFQIFLQKYLVHFARRPLVIAPQTIGPFSRRGWRLLAVDTAKRCAIVATRDAKSTAFLREIGYKKDLVEASDVALRLPYERPTVPEKVAPKIGINVSGLLMSGGYTGQNEFGLKSDYPSLIRELIRFFLEHEDSCEVHLLGHVIPETRGGVEDDYQACLTLKKDFPEVTVAPAFKTPSEAKSYISGLDFFMGARMHACIAAFSSGVPVVPMAYSRKFSGLFGSLGYDLTVDCTSDCKESIKNSIVQAYEARASHAENLKIALATGIEKLSQYENSLSTLIRDLKGGR